MNFTHYFTVVTAMQKYCLILLILHSIAGINLYLSALFKDLSSTLYGAEK